MAHRAQVRSFTTILLEVIGPALIMLMTGSLVFFLVAMFYRGPHEGRLCFVLGLFTFAAVLVSRISISEGREKGIFFGLVLAGATFLTSSTLVTFESVFGFLEPLILIGFIGVALWTVNKLTWDCTVIDNSRDVTATGLTDLVRRKLWGQETKSSGVPESDGPAGNELPTTADMRTSSDAQAGNFLKALFLGKGRQNTPGLWVFYFSVFALPIFAIGQWFIAASNDGWAIFLFAVYVASGFSLMATTSLLGLQRYLNQRNVEMPYQVAAPWMAISAACALVGLVLVLAFPRVNVSSSVRDGLAWFESTPRPSSDFSIGSDGQEERRNAAVGRQPGDDDKSNAADGKSSASGGQKQGEQQQGRTGNSNEKGKGSSTSPSESKSESQGGGGNKQKQDQSSSDSKPQNSGKQQSDQSQNQPSKNSPGEKQNAAENNQDNSKASDPNTEKNSPTNEDPRDAQERAKKQADERNKQSETKQEQSSSSGAPAPSNQSTPSRPPASARNQNNQNAASSPNLNTAFQSVGNLITWTIYLVAIAAIVVAAILFRREILEGVRQLLASIRKWLDGRQSTAESSIVEQALVPARRYKTFGEFSNPFTGNVRLTPTQIVSYMFAALEALARDCKFPRDANQTPSEFSLELGRNLKGLAAGANHLAHVYNQMAYGSILPESGELERLRAVWVQMEQTSVQRMTSQVTG